MLAIRPMEEKNKEQLMEMMLQFFNSPAVEHGVERQILEDTLEGALQKGSGLDGYALWEDAELIGFSFVSSYFCTERGGTCIVLEDLYLKEETRGKGYGTAYFQFVFDRYPHARRFRLEVTPSNEKAARLYERMGFQRLTYHQMYLDCPREKKS